jgi:hypothetical protein
MQLIRLDVRTERHTDAVAGDQCPSLSELPGIKV